MLSIAVVGGFTAVRERAFEDFLEANYPELLIQLQSPEGEKVAKWVFRNWSDFLHYHDG